jgi:predicted GIY-YIG superfamily endonuclease
MMKKNRKSAGIVYTVKCEITGKFYVGATTETIDDRKSDHNERVNRGESGKLQKAILTFGPEAFTWTQIDTANSVDELAQKEKEYYHTI